ncbi:hypothetical protein ASF41_15885 [Methylobacterium sp. Leaf111]|nr:hypothetical protein ASF41_15885 [Methylobacterium sp. Leaf111]
MVTVMGATVMDMPTAIAAMVAATRMAVVVVGSEPARPSVSVLPVSRRAQSLRALRGIPIIATVMRVLPMATALPLTVMAIKLFIV